LTTARTGPFCSTRTESTAPVNDSLRTAAGRSVLGLSCAEATRRPDPVMTVAPRRMDSTTFSPDRLNVTVITPVSTVICRRFWTTAIGDRGPAGAPGASR
jgi:hypothetical protein